MKNDPVAIAVRALALCFTALALDGVMRIPMAPHAAASAHDAALPAGRTCGSRAARDGSAHLTKETAKETAMNAVFGIVPDARAAARTVIGLKSAGFRADDVCVIFPDAADPDPLPRPATLEPLPPAPGAALLALPGFAPAGGSPLLATAAARAGAGLADLLAGLGVGAEDAALFQTRVEDGSILISVHAESVLALSSARDVLTSAGARDIGIAGDLAGRAAD